MEALEPDYTNIKADYGNDFKEACNIIRIHNSNTGLQERELPSGNIAAAPPS